MAVLESHHERETDTGAEHGLYPAPSHCHTGECQTAAFSREFYSPKCRDRSFPFPSGCWLCINPKLLLLANKSKIVTDPVVLCAETDFSTLHSLIKTR